MSRRYDVGAPMPAEPLLCEEFGVSRTVVREAVKSLVAKGLIVTGPKVGTRVLPEDRWNWFDPDVITWQARAGLTPEFLRDLLDLRRVVEPAAVRLAAERASAADIEEIEAGLRRHEAGGRARRRLRHHRPALPPRPAGRRAQPHAGADEQGAERAAAHQLRALDRQEGRPGAVAAAASRGARCGHRAQPGHAPSAPSSSSSTARAKTSRRCSARAGACRAWAGRRRGSRPPPEPHSFPDPARRNEHPIVKKRRHSMKLKALMIPDAGRAGPRCRRPGRRAGKAHRLVGQGLLQVRGRRAVRGDQEVRGQDRRQGRAVAVPGAGHDPEDGRRRSIPARRPTSPTPTSTTSRSPASGPSTASSRTSPTSSTPMKDTFPPNTRRDHLPLQRQDQEARLLRVPDQAADHAHPVLEGHAGRGGLQGVATSRRPGRPTGTSGATRCSRRTARRPASASTRIGQPMGVDSSDSFYSFLTFMDAYNVKLVDDNGKLLVDDPKVAPGPDQRADATTPTPYTQGLHAAVVDELEGPGQQRRLPQQDDRDDAQRDDLDRRQVARRHEQRRRSRAEQRAQAKKNYDELIAHRRLPEQARRLADGLPRGGQDRRDLQGREEQEARQGVRRRSCCRTRTCTPYVEGSLGRWFPVTKAGAAERVLAGRPAPQVGLQPVHGRHGDLRVHQELQVHDPQQRERLGQGDEPRRQRQGAGRQGGRRDDRPHQGRSRARRVMPDGRGVERRCRRPLARVLDSASRTRPPPAAAARRMSPWQTLGPDPARALRRSCSWSSCSTRWATACGSRAIRRATCSCSTTRSSSASVVNTIVFLVVAINLKMLVALVLSGFFVQTRWWIKLAVGAVHPAVGGAVDPDHPLDPLHAQPRVGDDQLADLPAHRRSTGRTGSTTRRWRSASRCWCTSGSRCRSGR